MAIKLTAQEEAAIRLTRQSVKLTGEKIHLRDQKLKLTASQKKNLKPRISLVGGSLSGSRQTRFSTNRRTHFFHSVMGWIRNIEDYEIPYGRGSSSTRDAWLSQVIQQEPFLNSVLSSVITIDRNRGWNMTGGERYVRKYTNLLHTIKVAPDIWGWREAMSVFSKSYHGTDIGAVIEVESLAGKLQGLYPVDSTKCHLTGSNETPLEYNGDMLGSRNWHPDWYIRICDSPSYLEELFGLGECAVTRSIELAKIMIALWQHDKEKLLATAPRGILLLKGISQDQWDNTLADHEAEMSSLERKYYTGVQVLASDGLSDIDARMMSLSEIPETMDQSTFTNLLMMFYALAFGYDPREFWPVSSGSFGTVMESQLQHDKATQKGGMDFIVNVQEKFQRVLPRTVSFEFEQRDTTAKAQEEQLKASIINNVIMLLTPVGAEQTTLISAKQALNLLAAEDIIPPEWTTDDEIMLAEDTEDNTGSPLSLIAPEVLKLMPAEDQRIIKLLPQILNLTSSAGVPVRLSLADKKEQLHSLADTIRLVPAVARSLYFAPDEPIVRYDSAKDRFQILPIAPTPHTFYSLPGQ